MNINLDWRETEEGWFASHPIGNGRCVEVTVHDDIVMLREGTLDAAYVVDDEDGRRFAERIAGAFITFANVVSRQQWAASNLKVLS